MMKIGLIGLLLATFPVHAFAASGEARWWKGNLHTHSYWSDGNDFPEMIADAYRSNGYHFLSLTDHNILSRGEKWMEVDREHPERILTLGKYIERFGEEWVETRGDFEEGNLEVRLKPLVEVKALLEKNGRFLLLEGEEITDGADDGHSIHMNAIHLGELIPPPGGATVMEVIRKSLTATRRQAARHGLETLFFVNHLNYDWAVTAADLAAEEELRFLEVWNGVQSDNDPGNPEHPSTDEKWDAANEIRMAGRGWPPLFAVGNDDTHDYHGFSDRALPFRAWIMVRAPYLTPEHLLRAMRGGDFYVSTGVEIEEIIFHDEELRLRLNGLPGEAFTTRFIGVRRAGDGSTETGVLLKETRGKEPVYRMRGDELYVRAVVTSNFETKVPSTEFAYQRAWTQPVGWR